MTVLDVGCGEKPYRNLFGNVEYVGIDVRKDSHADVICDAKHLPFREGSFSICLSFQVFEHVDEPIPAVEEIFRVLSFNGFVFISLPASWVIHGAPNDYWRWTQYGVKKLLEDFSLQELYRCRGSVASLIQTCELFIPRKLKMLIVLFNMLGIFLDKSVWLDKWFAQFDINYFAVAKKEENHECKC
jgi:SAM-dependent methyltransferase